MSVPPPYKPPPLTREKKNKQRFDSTIITNDLKLLSAVPGEAVFELTVQATHTNLLGVMHGGCVATVLDICTSAALIPGAKEGFWEFP